MAESNGNTGLADCTGEAGYTNLFNQRDYSSNKEVLLWRKYSVTDGQYTRWGAYYYGAGRGITKNLVDSYLCKDGKPISTSDMYQGDKTLKDVVANRDPRLNQTIFVDDEKHTLLRTIIHSLLPLLSKALLIIVVLPDINCTKDIIQIG